MNVRGVEEVEMLAPVSPMGQYVSSSVLSLYIIGVFEFEKAIDDSNFATLVNDVLIPINHRFSSIMVEAKDGVKHWKRVDVKVEDHMKLPRFPEGLSLQSYDDYFNDYLSKIAMDPLPQTMPLWEIHIIKYPTSNASGSVIFKLHHALGDGYSLMGSILSCLHRADNPSLPLTFPNFRNAPKSDNYTKRIIGVTRSVLNTVSDFSLSLLKSNFLRDSPSPIRSGEDGVEFRPVNITTMTFSLDQIKKIKANLKVTLNDVVAGVIFLGTRLYMETTSKKAGKTRSTALVLLNTRSIGGYKSVDEMLQNQETQKLWGNQFAFLHVSVPKLHQSNQSLNPLKFVYNSHDIIKRNRNSWVVYLTGKLLEYVRKSRGPEVAAKYIYNTLKNASMVMTNVVGPLEKMALYDQTIKGFYFTVVNDPQGLTVTVVSYMDQLYVTLRTEKSVIDHLKLKTCIEESYDMIFKAAVNSK